MAFRVLGIGSSLRDNASSTTSLSITLDLAKKYGAETRLLDLKKNPLPMFDPVENKSNSDIQKAQDDVLWSDALILSTPDYHGSMSGAMKNFLDYFWSEFAGKTFGYICSSHEKGLTAMDQMRTAVRQCYGWSMPYGVSVIDRDDFTDGKINPKLESRLDMLARDLVVYGNILRQQFVKDLTDSDNTFASRYRK
ncbi:MAG: NADPH-dependent FMN reductase [Nitrosotalea sp.]